MVSGAPFQDEAVGGGAAGDVIEALTVQDDTEPQVGNGGGRRFCCGHWGAPFRAGRRNTLVVTTVDLPTPHERRHRLESTRRSPGRKGGRRSAAVGSSGGIESRDRSGTVGRWCRRCVPPRRSCGTIRRTAASHRADPAGPGTTSDSTAGAK